MRPRTVKPVGGGLIRALKVKHSALLAHQVYELTHQTRFGKVGRVGNIAKRKKTSFGNQPAPRKRSRSRTTRPVTLRTLGSLKRPTTTRRKP